MWNNLDSFFIWVLWPIKSISLISASKDAETEDLRDQPHGHLQAELGFLKRYYCSKWVPKKYVVMVFTVHTLKHWKYSIK